MRSDSSHGSLLDSVGFVLRHLWVFIYPIVIIMSVVLAFTSTRPLIYESKAIVVFKSTGSELISAKFIEKRQDLIGGILIGDNLRDIIKEVWPEMKEEANPGQYFSLMEMLRDPSGGIRMWYDKDDPKSDEKGPKEFLNIAFSNSEPTLCYKIVNATINVIKKTNKVTSEQVMETGLTFLKKQIEFYTEKLRIIDEEMIRIRTELKLKYAYLSEEERGLIDETLGPTLMNIKTQAKTQQIADYDQKLTELKLQLVELERARDNIQSRLDKGDVSTAPISDSDVGEDAFIKGYSEAIANKELAMAGLMSQGYMPEHPQIKKTQKEIENLKILREQRVDELLSSPTVSNTIKISRTEGLRNELKNTIMKIETANIKIRTLQDYIKTSQEKLKPGLAGATGISAQTLRLIELKNEKDINQKYYNDIRQQLEVGEIKNRLQKEDGGLRVEVVEEPKVPTSPIPLQKVKFLVIGLMISVATGVGLAYLVDSLDNSIKTSSDLRRFLQVPVLASIDQINTQQDIRLEQIRKRLLFIGLAVSVAASYFIGKFFLKYFVR